MKQFATKILKAHSIDDVELGIKDKHSNNVVNMSFENCSVLLCRIGQLYNNLKEKTIVASISDKNCTIEVERFDSGHNYSSKTNLRVQTKWDIATLKTELNSKVKWHYSISDLHLIFNGLYLQNDNSLYYYNVQNRDYIVCITSADGGSLLEFMSWLRTKCHAYDLDQDEVIQQVKLNKVDDVDSKEKDLELQLELKVDADIEYKQQNLEMIEHEVKVNPDLQSMTQEQIAKNPSSKHRASYSLDQLHKSVIDQISAKKMEKLRIAMKFGKRKIKKVREEINGDHDALDCEKKSDVKNINSDGGKKSIAKKYHTVDWNKIEEAALTAIYLWTTPLIYKKVNKALSRLSTESDEKSNDNIGFNMNCWKIFLNLLDYGLRQLPYCLDDVVYRGIHGNIDINEYVEGDVICWPRITSTSRSKDQSMKFLKPKPKNPKKQTTMDSQKNDTTTAKININISQLKLKLTSSKNSSNTIDNASKNINDVKVLFEINSIDGRDITDFSMYGDEEEVVFLPFSHFRVIKVERKEYNLRRSIFRSSNGNNVNSFKYYYIKLQQIQIPRSAKIVIWVDDNPKNNLKWIYRLEKRGISVIICKTTQECIGVIETYKWILYLKNAQLRIVTDMNRYDNNIAGVELIKKLRNPPHCFDNDILIFSMRDDIAKQHCIDNNVTNNVFVTKYGNVVQKFVFFKQLDDKYKVRV